jgi:hypothetical protein
LMLWEQASQAVNPRRGPGMSDSHNGERHSKSAFGPDRFRPFATFAAFANCVARGFGYGKRRGHQIIAGNPLSCGNALSSAPSHDVI